MRRQKLKRVGESRLVFSLIILKTSPSPTSYFLNYVGNLTFYILPYYNVYVDSIHPCTIKKFGNLRPRQIGISFNTCCRQFATSPNIEFWRSDFTKPQGRKIPSKKLKELRKGKEENMSNTPVKTTICKDPDNCSVICYPKAKRYGI